MIEAKETVVGSLGSTSTLSGTTNISNTYTSDYTLPIASADTLGGIKVGENLNITEDGTLNANKGISSYNELTDKPSIPTKTSQLENDIGFINSIPSEYITEEELTSKGYLTRVPNDYKTKAENDELYQPIGDYALSSDIPTVPTKTSDLTNDSGFITEVPEEYITEDELNNKGYLTEHQNISHLATKEELHNHSNKEVLDSISQENIDSWNSGTGGGSGTTDYTDLSNKPSINGVELSGNKTTSDLGISVPTKTSELTNDSGFISSVPSEYITETELASKNYATKSELHTHSNKSVLDSITQKNVTNWNNCVSSRVGTYIQTYNSASLTLTPKTFTKLGFNTVAKNTTNGGLVCNNSRVTVGSGISQVLIISKWTDWTTTCKKYIYIYKNGSLFEASSFAEGAYTASIISYIDVVEGDYIEIYGYHDHTANISVGSNVQINDLKITIMR